MFKLEKHIGGSCLGMLLLSSVICFLSMTGVRAQGIVTIVDNSLDPQNTQSLVNSSDGWAQEFTMPANGVSYTLAGLNVWDVSSSGTQSTVLATLWTVLNGIPNTEIGSIGSQTISGTPTTATLNPSNPLPLSPGASYAVELNFADTAWSFEATDENNSSG